MGVSAAIFESGGKRTEHVVPGVYSRSNNVTSPQGVSAGNLVILGNSTGGEPGKLLSFGTLSEAKDALVSGELLNAIGYAFNGSSEFIPQNVFAMRVNNGTQSDLTLSVDETPLLKIKSWDWGTHCNQLKLRLESGTAENSKKLTVGYKEKIVSVDNIVKPSLSIEYIGDGDSAVVSVNSNGISFVAKESGEIIDQDSFTVSFDDYTTVEELVSRINDTNYQAVMLDNTVDASSKELDTISSIDVTTNTVFYSNLSALISALNSVEYIGSVEYVGNNTRMWPTETEGFVYFANGTAGTYTTSDWINALQLLETEDVQIIATPCDNIDIQTAIKNHCDEMSSTTNRKERTCILGSGKEITDEVGIANAIALNDEKVSYVIDSAIAVNPITLQKEVISGAMVAVMLAGMESAMAVNNPLTFKTLKVLGFTKKRTISNMTKLIQAGVMVCNPNPENAAEYMCIRAVTTYQGNNDLISCERSMVREDLYMNRDLRNRYTNTIGKVGDVSEDEVKSVLRNTAREWKNAGYIIPAGGENVWNIKVKFSGDKTYLTYSRYLTAPRNFVFITATNHVYESTTEL